MISVIVPVYQASKTLEKCVGSIQAQTYKDLELILVDDGSSDGSGELCDRLALRDKRIRVLHGENHGAAYARNKGLAEASGEWICFIDSDDLVSAAYLSTLLRLAEDHGADIASCAHIKRTESQIRENAGRFPEADHKEHISVYNGHEGVRALLYQKGFISAPWGMISKKKLWSGVSFPEGRAAEDMATIYRLFLAASRIIRTDAALYCYVLSADNTVYSTSSKRNPDYYRHSRRMLSVIRKDHPDCLRAACSRHLSACFQILSETDPDTKDGNELRLINRIYRDIRSVRHLVITDRQARIRNRAAAALSIISIGAIHRKLHERYLAGIPSSARHITMVEYQGRCDEEGRAVGHAPKVISEYLSLISDSFVVDVFAPEVIIKEMNTKPAAIHELPHRIVMKGNNSVSDRILNKLRMFLNIRHALKNGKTDIVWFFNVEFYLFLYLALFGARGKKIVVTLFYEGYRTGALAGLKQKIFEIGQKRVFRCMAAGPGFKYKNMESVFVPDYVCDDSFSEWSTRNKENCAVCLGTMDRGKQLEELIRAFSRISYRLLIAGRFYDKAWLKELRSIASENTEIRDEYLQKEEYMSLLGHASYAVLPYDEEHYSSQTSGVMQEAVFTDTIVLTHRDILSGNRIPGVGFGSYDEITDELLSPDDPANSGRNAFILSEYKRLRRTVYDPASVKERMKKSLSV